MPLLAALFLAQADSPPADFGPWLANLMYVILSAAGIVGGLAAWKSYREKPAELPNPLTVTQQVAFVPRTEFEKAIKEAHGRMNREKQERDAEFALMREEITAIRENITANHEAGEARAGKIHDRINILVNDNAAMPARIVELLRATKGLLG